MRLLDDEALAKEKGIRRSKVQKWRDVRAKKFPAPVKIGARNFWLESEIDGWIAERIRQRDEAAA